MKGRARDSIYTTAGLSLVSGVSQLLCLLYNTTFCNNYFFVGPVIVIDLPIGFPIHECKSQTQYIVKTMHLCRRNMVKALHSFI